MAAAYVFKLGTQTFFDLRHVQTGNGPDCPLEQVEEISRYGIKGVGVRLNNVIGERFVMRGYVDVATELAAETLKMTTYPALVGTQQDIMWKGRSYATIHSLKYWVKYVTTSYKYSPTIVGGLLAAKKGFVVVSEWTLIPNQVV